MEAVSDYVKDSSRIHSGTGRKDNEEIICFYRDIYDPASAERMQQLFSCSISFAITICCSFCRTRRICRTISEL